MLILGIESTCYETAASIVKDGVEVLSSVVATQFEFHKKYAGVVPEIASRRHQEVINFVIEDTINEAGVNFGSIDAISVSYYPGLIGSLLVGVTVAKTLSFALKKPLIGINHIEAHLFSIHFNNKVEYPIIGLVLSGGHTLLMKSDRIGHFEILGSTIDDAIGEAFDKIAKHLGLGYPGGPAIEKAAKNGSENAYSFPRVILNGGRDRYNFSYSGLKNAVINQRHRFLNPGFKESVENIAASFQAAATDVILTKALWASNDLKINRVAITGGVANNSRLKKIFFNEKRLTTYFPEPKYTSDNAAMVAGLAYFKFREGVVHNLELEPMSRIKSIIKGKRAKYGK